MNQAFLPIDNHLGWQWSVEVDRHSIMREWVLPLRLPFHNIAFIRRFAEEGIPTSRAVALAAVRVEARERLLLRGWVEVQCKPSVSAERQGAAGQDQEAGVFERRLRLDFSWSGVHGVRPIVIPGARGQRDGAAALILRQGRRDQELVSQQVGVVNGPQLTAGWMPPPQRSDQRPPVGVGFGRQRVKEGKQSQAEADRLAADVEGPETELPGLTGRAALGRVSAEEGQQRAQLEPAEIELLGRGAAESADVGAGERDAG